MLGLVYKGVGEWVLSLINRPRQLPYQNNKRTRDDTRVDTPPTLRLRLPVRAAPHGAVSCSLNEEGDRQRNHSSKSEPLLRSTGVGPTYPRYSLVWKDLMFTTGPPLRRGDAVVDIPTVERQPPPPGCLNPL